MHPFFARSLGQHHTLGQATATVFSLASLGVFEARGPDALSFLQGQLTNDIVAPGIGQSRLAGYCTAQGRLLSTMVLGQTPMLDEELAARGFMRADILAPVLKRLSMFVLRAKVTLQVKDLKVAGVCAPKSQYAALVAELGHSLPELEWETVHTSTGTWIAAPSAVGNSSSHEPISRWWWIAGEEHLAALDTLQLGWTIGQDSDWESLDIQAGLPWVEAGTQDIFIPQTLNLELIGGVSFTKGCYPGQEIVARSHYRGTVKKRMALGTVVTSEGQVLLPGADIFDASQSAQQPCGRLINVATIQSDSKLVHWILFETSFEAYDRQQLRAIDEHGPAIETLALPYLTR